MQNSILLILVTLLTACGGEAFNSEFDPVAGGDAGAADVTPAGGSVTAGTSSAGGMAAGQSAGGTGAMPVAGSASAGEAAGGAPSATCDFRAADLSAVLPVTLTWHSFDLAKNGMCAACAYEPCGQMKIVWGEPVVNGNTVTYKASYAPSGTTPMTMRVASSSNCATANYGMCDVKLTPAPISLTVTRQGDGWVVSKAEITVWFSDDACISAIGKPGDLVEQMNLDLQAEITPLLINLKIPCN
jgi:hypothetical protein